MDWFCSDVTAQRTDKEEVYEDELGEEESESESEEEDSEEELDPAEAYDPGVLVGGIHGVTLNCTWNADLGNTDDEKEKAKDTDLKDKDTKAKDTVKYNDLQRQFGIKFHGAHYPGLDQIVITWVDKSKYPNDEVKKNDQIVGIFDEPVHPGTDWQMLSSLMKERYNMMAKDGIIPPSAPDPDKDPDDPDDAKTGGVKIHLKRKLLGKYVYDSEKNFIYDFARETFIKGDEDLELGPECRGFELCLDKNLFMRAVRHMEDVKKYLEDDLNQMTAKAKLVAMEGSGAKPALLTDLMRQETQILFMTELNEKLKERGEKRKRIAANMNRATHGTSPKHVALKHVDEAVVSEIEQQIIVLCQARIKTIMKYSEYDFRADLNRIQDEISGCDSKIQVLKKQIRKRRKKLYGKKGLGKDLEHYSQLLHQSERCKIPFMDYIFSKEMEICALYEEIGQMGNLKIHFPQRNVFWQMDLDEMEKLREKMTIQDRTHMLKILEGRTPIVYG